jgi:hypothetical protein
VILVLRERAPYVKLLAVYTVTEKEAAAFEWAYLTGSKP